ncbi:hypothetical protein KIN20_006713 [Parelaphostrongylus tenuis]|uniref:Uncharacterized protein n=1 Tax=Parelaphostrongylus tenuis TaxID=148309 RepID=A0AAD5M260_PARTN|nr:hypothetical protein KIN20_006713 [Parelaphostrongylus tenuis]
MQVSPLIVGFVIRSLKGSTTGKRRRNNIEVFAERSSLTCSCRTFKGRGRDRPRRQVIEAAASFKPAGSVSGGFRHSPVAIL